MDAKTLAALERAVELCDDEAGRWLGTVHTRLVALFRADAALIRALIERERAGGERAKVVAFARQQTRHYRVQIDAAYKRGDASVAEQWIVAERNALEFARAIAAGAHMEAGE